MNIRTISAAAKLLALQGLTQVTLLAFGASMKEACVATCIVAALAPLYSGGAHRLYRQAFRSA